jgi:Rad3-related DNA helicase
VNPARIIDEFPAPSFRGTQKDALERVRAAFEAGNDVVLVRAPTGSGKSLLARAVMGCCRRAGEADPADPAGAFYTTPQVSQLDDVGEDDLLADLQIIRGKNNYGCILPTEEGTPVDRAPCARIPGYDCAVKHRCPYFSDRAIASSRAFAAMTLAYFMQTAGSEVFGKRDVVVIDEAHGLAEWAEMYATIRLDERTVPVWADLRVPEIESLDRAVTFAENLAAVCESEKDDLLAQDELSAAEAGRRDRLQDLKSDLEWFVDDYRNPDSPTTWVVDQPDSAADAASSKRGRGHADGAGGPITVKPVNPERYLHHTVWDRGEKFALLSATILDKDAFCRQVGLDPSRVALVDVEHTFPVENRPLYDVTQGKMTFEHREETLPDVARVLVRVMAAHPDEKGIVHCHSYDIQERLADRLREFGVGSRLRAHDRDGRDAELEAWKAAAEPEVFLSVKMEEALDLEGDLARWQVVCKAPFLNTGDSRVAQRLEDGQWAWYYRTALRTVIQAAGRVVRAPDDHGATYLADSSLLDVFDRASGDVPPWFGEQVERMTRPDLPAFDPEAAVAGISGSTPEPATTPEPVTSQSSSGRTQPTKSSDDGGSTGGDRRSPMADVWDTE